MGKVTFEGIIEHGKTTFLKASCECDMSKSDKLTAELYDGGVHIEAPQTGVMISKSSDLEAWARAVLEMLKHGEAGRANEHE